MDIQTLNEILFNCGLLLNSFCLKNLENFILKRNVKTRKVNSPSKHTLNTSNTSFTSIYYEEPELIKRIIFEWIIENELFMKDIIKDLNIILMDNQENELINELKRVEIKSIRELREEIKKWWQRIPKNIFQILKEIKLIYLSENEEKSLYNYLIKQTGLSKEVLLKQTYNTGKIIKFVQRWIRTLPNCYGSIIIYNLDDVGTTYVELGYDKKEEIKINFNEDFENFFEKTLKLIDYDRKRVNGLYDPLSPNTWKHDFLEYGEIFYFGPLEVPQVVLKWLNELLKNSVYKDNFFISNDYDLLEKKINKRKEELLEKSFEKLLLTEI